MIPSRSTNIAAATFSAVLIASASPQLASVAAFSPSLATHSTISTATATTTAHATPTTSIDVSDLGLTMEDLDKPIPAELFGDFKITTSGYQSTSRVESVNDEGCLWEESSDAIEATLSIEGLRGQPVGAMDLAISKTSVTVSVFGYSVWSCILKGECVPESAAYQIQDGYDKTPLITLSIAKKKESASDKRWDGFIESVGEDSIL
uniref:Uncharacterized protein n=1 Tax=Pseudo-nitzschia australis TaxID=44445 RepID=A0A7S4ATZ3_9STRA|mmetsp:Transcript_26435/g.57932  ORF Transcript_26435/g.57932 Transcript_26435/m.57932 type:complete len:206 (+) Transcript_26435:104-721(+)|eukprot:CAMPEP_0168182524 /NCGR_PEP_ID=MMETSP0139_2-20121125/11941_1 /TAXON_ID=44445 /ORGANISM="Pseudo-nitzschia australis, Strain 10249 10 AB" /LENGTH=205 /DNA_ID=CAMNT_0008103463 /DNA_START=85 /DNA_END=702 /DNA_ORIENTATION=-